MRLIAIETSCDETAIAYLDANGDETAADFKILGNGLLSQIDIHKEYGGVYPAVAKREHARNLVAVLDAALQAPRGATPLSEDVVALIRELLLREEGLADALLAYLGTHESPAIDAIAVTYGPGLAPALWVGVNFAKALSAAWSVPIVGVNHMEGHFLAALATREDDATLSIRGVSLPALGLLISGGHTELDLMRSWLSYELIGRTRDDAVGEAYDKVARMLSLPYPGGPEISRLAEGMRGAGKTTPISFPRPMMDAPHFDFSFAGLKTAVLYFLKKEPDADPAEVALAFEEAAGEVLVAKTRSALTQTGARTLAVGGGVSANAHVRRALGAMIENEFNEVSLRVPHPSLTGDNGIMIGLAGFYRALRKEFADPHTLSANGNLELA